MSPPPWLWIVITIGAGFAQTLRNAAQKHLTAELGTPYYARIDALCVK